MSDLTIWQALQQANLVEGEMPRDTQPHWSSRFLLGLVGWIAALFLLFFLFLTFEQLTREANSALLLTLGLACLGLQLLALPLVMAAITFCWLRADRDPERHQLYHSITLGLALSLLVLGRLHHPLWDGGSSVLDELGLSRLPLWLNPLICAALLLAVMVKLRLPLLFGLPLVLISAIIPGMGAGALVLILGFYAGSLGLMTLSALLLLGYGSLYYYDLGLTLMTKSWLLLGSGILLLGARQLLTTFAARSDS